MRRLLLGLVASLLIAGSVFAQSTPKVYWEHDGVNVTHFQCLVDGVLPSNLGALTPDSGTTYSVNITSCVGVMNAGAHTLKVQACNAYGCTDSVAITVVKL